MDHGYGFRGFALLLALSGTVLFACPARLGAQRPASVAEVQVAPRDATVPVGKTLPFLVTAFDSAGRPIARATFTWTSSNPRVATIDQNGMATGVGVGVAIVTARTGTGRRAKSGQATLQVTNAAGAVQPQQAVPTRVPAAPPALAFGYLEVYGVVPAPNEIVLDGEPLGGSALSAPRPLPEGTHQLRFEGVDSLGRWYAQRTVEIRPGDTTRLVHVVLQVRRP